MTNISPSICIIGAGSAQFTLDLIRDLCLTEGLHGSTVWLIGHVNREKIDLVHDVGSRYSEEIVSSGSIRSNFIISGLA